MSSSHRAQVLLIGGCSGAGKSSATAEIHAQLSRAGVVHAVIEGDYLDLAWPAPHERGLRLAERNLQTLWRAYQEAGYQRLIYTNTVCVRGDIAADLIDLLGDDVEVRGVLLTAEQPALIARLAGREHGTGLQEHLERSTAAAAELALATAPWVIRMDTTTKTVEQIAQEIIDHVGWTQKRCSDA